MAAATIGSVTVDILKGRPAALKTRLEVWQVPGIDGYGATQLGNGDAEAELESISFFTSLINAESHISNCNALQGTLVSIVDNWGIAFSNILITRVDDQDAKHPILYKGSAGAMIVIRWRMVTTSP